MAEMLNKNIKYPCIRLSKEFVDILEKIKEHMKKFSYGILEVSNVDASKLLAMKIEKSGGIEKFLNRYRLDVE